MIKVQMQIIKKLLRISLFFFFQSSSFIPTTGFSTQEKSDDYHHAWRLLKTNNHEDFSIYLSIHTHTPIGFSSRQLAASFL